MFQIKQCTCSIIKPSPRYLFTLFLLILFSIIAKGQTPLKRVISTFIYDYKVFNYEFTIEDVDNYNFTISSMERDTVINNIKANLSAPKDSILDSISIVTNSKSISTKVRKYVFSDFTEDKFSTVFALQMKDKFNYDEKSEDIKRLATRVFFTIKAKLQFLDDEPITANLVLKKNEVLSFLKSNSSTYYRGDLQKVSINHIINKVMVEMEDGAIKNIKLQTTDSDDESTFNDSPRKYLEFKNLYPISISGKHDAEKFADIYLYCINCYGIKGLTRYTRLSDLLSLDIILENDKDDYSPANSVITLSPSLPIIQLKKEKRSRIIEVTAFSDFIGLDQEQPNGLIQIEVKRKINLNTVYRPFFRISENEEIANKYDLNKYAIYFQDQEKTDKNQKTTKKIKYKYFYVLNKDSLINTAPVGTPLYKSKQKDIVNYFNSPHFKDSLKIEPAGFRPAYYNIFSSVEPRLLFSKLEENNRYLLLNSTNLDGNRIDAIQLFKYQVVSFGLKFNLFKINYPQAKFTWNVLEMGGGIGIERELNSKLILPVRIRLL